MAGGIAFVVRQFIEGVFVVIAVYLLAGKKIAWTKYVGLGLLLGAITNVIRLLPIHYGVHTLILILVIIFLMTGIGKIEFYKAASSSILFIIILYFSEWITTVFFNSVLKIAPEELFTTSVTGALISLIPLIVSFGIVVLIVVIRKNAKK